MRLLTIQLLFSLTLFGSSVIAQDNLPNTTFRTLVYRDLPVAFTMPVGAEKVISFPEDVQWSLPRELNSVVTGEAINGTVYLTTTEEFERARFRFRGIDSNQHYIFDITATKTGESSAIRVLTSTDDSKATTADAPVNSNPNGRTNTRKTPAKMGLAEITRHVFQRIYAPDRLLKGTAMLSTKDIKDPPTFNRMFPGLNVSATPFSEWWTPDGTYATAIKLINNETRNITLDPRYIRSSASWVTFSAISHDLKPAGQYGDTAVAVVITRQPFLSVTSSLE